MTREEAIEQLKVYRACMIADGADVEAYNMAIEALEQEPILDCRECKVEHDCYECKKYDESEE